MPNNTSSDKQLQAVTTRLAAIEKRLTTVEAQLREQAQDVIQAEVPHKPKGA